MNKLKKKLKKNKEGAASFYVVVFATLVLLVVVTSFAAVIATEMTKSSNDDLAQSAYDSAMAGVEDAKLAYYNYQKCISQGSGVGLNVTPNINDGITCDEIIWFVEANEEEYSKSGFERCDMVKNILGRGTDLALEESNTGGVSNNMQQDYTCTQFDDSLGDYRSTLSSSSTTKIVRAEFDDVAASQIKKVKISWYADTGDDNLNYNNFNNNGVTFGLQPATPPTISLALIQTANNFSLSDFDMTIGVDPDRRTDRGMIYLVPTKDSGKAEVYDEGSEENYINVNGFLKSNDKTTQNDPYVVYCDPDGSDKEFLCSATVELPEPINGNRSDDTFMFVVGLPYGKPSTDFSMEFYCADGASCSKYNAESEEAVATDNTKAKANLKGVQVSIDSTGRANDLYRRVEARLEDNSGDFLSIFGPLELLSGMGGDKSNISLDKNLIVTEEWNFKTW